LHNGTFTGTLIDYLSVYFTNLWGRGTPALGIDWKGFHLYYILYLFIFTLILIPLFLLLKKEKGQQIIDKVGNFFKIPGTLYLPFLLILGIEFFDIKVIQVNVPGYIFGRIGGWSFLTYFILIFYGFIIASNKKFEISIDKHSKFSGFLAIILGAIGLPIFLFNKSNTIGIILMGFYSWSLIITVLSLARKYLNIGNRASKYLRQAALPLYIIHPLFNQILSYYIYQLSIPNVAKFFLFLGSTLICILASVALIVQFNVLRVLYGLKWRKKKKKEVEEIQEEEEEDVTIILEDEN
jgi:hypothetical protein